MDLFDNEEDRFVFTNSEELTNQLKKIQDLQEQLQTAIDELHALKIDVRQKKTVNQ